MFLSHICNTLNIPFSGKEDLIITGVQCDSRFVTPGDIFVVIPSAHQQQYVEQARQKGAVCLLTNQENIFNDHAIPTIIHNNPRQALAHLANLFYPKTPPHVVAVTGTNGKSSVVSLVNQISSFCGHLCASLGTVGFQSTSPIPLPPQFESLTAQNVLVLRQLLEKTADIHTFAFEASSHGLAQYRLHQVPLTAAAFTNLTQDHLDYHGTMANYFNEKAKLFSEILPASKIAVFHKNTPYFNDLVAVSQKRQHTIVSYALEDTSADLSFIDIQAESDGFLAKLWYKGQVFSVPPISLTGKFQLENLLCATALCLATDLTIAQCIASFKILKSVPGRMEKVAKTHSGATIYVDYAHTPDALETVLKNLKEHCTGRLITIFGCGGNRDKLKRPLMGKIAQDLSDIAIVTDDNPRFEDPAQIRLEIKAQAPHLLDKGERRTAIAYAVSLLQKGDILLVAGKGHEQGQTINGVTYPFCDKQIVLDYLAGVNANDNMDRA